MTNIDTLSIATIRSLVIDMINKANSGHPGMAVGSAPILYTLYKYHMNTTSSNGSWINRDRFSLASGHASSLLYAILHLSGYNITMKDLKNFRQLNSPTPGHPEHWLTHGVDTASGPLGQGVPCAIGMALTEKILSSRFNKEDITLIDHYTYALCGDGDIQEGVTLEAASLAGLWGLGKLIVLYDSNGITLDGPLKNAYNANTKALFEAMHWQVLNVEDGNNIDEINTAIIEGKKNTEQPTLIIVNTVIGQGSVNEGTHKVHGAPLGKADGKRAKLSYDFDYPEFTIPEEVYEDFNQTCIKNGKSKYLEWVQTENEYRSKYPEDYKVFIDGVNNEPVNIDFSELEKKYVPGFQDATRNSSNEILNVIAKQVPMYFSGSSDLASSTKTMIHGSGLLSKDDFTARNIAFGIREFGMFSIMNGMVLHKGLRISGGGFLVFSDYGKAALRMAGLSSLPIILPFSHDSIAVGEDGPTHQPVEQINTLRMIPNFVCFRPADAKELMGCWEWAINSVYTPTAICLTRQNVPVLENTDPKQVGRGAYIVSKEKEKLDVIIIATGSEVALAIEAQKILFQKHKIDARVVSMPSMELFGSQVYRYQQSILPNSCDKRVSLEMGHTGLMYKYIGRNGLAIGVNSFGQAAPAKVVMSKYGFNVEDIVVRIRNYM
ncbi:MAG: transketolase [Bacillota bacterium]|nr:transketolase [Bacillota bacterium]